MKLPAVVVSFLVLIHHALALIHGGDHETLAIPMAVWQTIFINTVIVVVPLVGAILCWTAMRRFGLIAVVVGMAGALVFGVVHHYMLLSPDHIAHLPSGEANVHESFQMTAGAIAMLEGITATVAAFFWGVDSSRA